ncbi:MAG: 2-oxoacid:acceptor oxidoreductase subunit alpha [Myxococcales bacterium]|nr:2-oxoacid:acceptor oxidoreductase subunit alpha [Myxococcales bacterium]
MSSASMPEGSSSVAVQRVREHIVEFVCDSGEGAQTAGQLLGTVAAKSGHGVWTVEIIPAEIEPPVRSRAGASGNRVRMGRDAVTNMGDGADVVVAFNEQVLYSRTDVGAFKRGTVILLERKWAVDPSQVVRAAYADAIVEFGKVGYDVVEVPMEAECMRVVEDPRRGKNIWALGMVTWLYDLDVATVEIELGKKLRSKGEDVVARSLELLSAGYSWAAGHLRFRYRVDCAPRDEARVVMNGNEALALGTMAAGIEVCSMYPITPATSVSHYLARSLKNVGGFVHQAEDEISAMGFAVGAAYAGKTPVTVTSGPGLALKSEFIGLAVMAELPLVIIDVQRGGPSTGLPTRVEQGDLLTALFGQPGDTPKIVIAPSTIEECFHDVVLARKLAETFRGPVILLSDANLATGQQPFRRPVPNEAWLSPPVDRCDWDPQVPPFAWDPETGLSSRPIPGQTGGAHVVTGLAHDERSRVAYESPVNQRAIAARSRKLATLFKSLRAPAIHGADHGELLVVGWGSTRGAIEEAVDRIRADGGAVSSVHLRFLSPLEPGLADIFRRFERVMTVEVNYSDDADDPTVPKEARRYAQLAWLLRARTLCDVECWSRVPGMPLPPGTIETELRARLDAVGVSSARSEGPPQGRGASA